MGAVIPKNGGTIYIKPNGVHFAPHTFTDPAVLEVTLTYLSDHGYTRLAVMEPAALPAEGITISLIPNSRAREIAIQSPRALNEPVGLTPSSLI